MSDGRGPKIKIDEGSKFTVEIETWSRRQNIRDDWNKETHHHRDGVVRWRRSVELCQKKEEVEGAICQEDFQIDNWWVELYSFQACWSQRYQIG